MAATLAATAASTASIALARRFPRLELQQLRIDGAVISLAVLLFLGGEDVGGALVAGEQVLAVLGDSSAESASTRRVISRMSSLSAVITASTRSWRAPASRSVHLQAIVEEGQQIGLDLEREAAAPLSMTMRITPSAARRSANGSREPVGFSSMAQKPVSRSSLSASATAMATGSAGHPVGRAERLVVVGDGVGDGGRLALRQRVVAAHEALQFGELADHAGDEVGLGQHRGALGLLDIGADLRGDLGGQLHQPLDALELGAELGVEHHLLELGQAVLERQCQVGLVEELRIATGGRG